MIIPIGFKNRQIERTTDVNKTPLPTHGRGHLIQVYRRAAGHNGYLLLYTCIYISFRYKNVYDWVGNLTLPMYRWVGIFMLWYIIWSYFYKPMKLLYCQDKFLITLLSFKTMMSKVDLCVFILNFSLMNGSPATNINSI